MRKQTGEKCKLTIKPRPRWLYAVLAVLPLVSRASTGIPFLGLLSPSAVLDVNFSERIRKNKERQLMTQSEKGNSCSISMFTQQF